MRNIIKSITAILFIAFTISSCDKKNELVTNAVGNATVLSTSAATIAPAPSDSNSTALSFTWTSPNYAQAPTSYKYILQIDTAGRNFAKASTRTITGVLKTSFSAKEINVLALSYGFLFNVAYGMEARIISSYGNNNEQYVSNVVKFLYTPYKVPPKIALPTSNKLFLVGDASQGGWNNPVPVPTQEFSKIDETTFGGVFNLVGGKQFLVLPVNGDWTNKFAVDNGSVPSAGGDFGYNLSTNFNGPAANGWYKIILDFQTGKFNITPFTGTLPNNLFIVGDATAGGWNNPVPVPSQQLTRLNSSEFKATALPMTGNKEYLLLPVNGDWSNKYSVQDNSIPGLWSGGDFGYNLPQNFKGPTTTGNYTLTVNFVTGKFKVQ
jgi:starch-binding outer membrane protein SusE/F